MREMFQTSLIFISIYAVSNLLSLYQVEKIAYQWHELDEIHIFLVNYLIYYDGKFCLIVRTRSTLQYFLNFQSFTFSNIKYMCGLP